MTTSAALSSKTTMEEFAANQALVEMVITKAVLSDDGVPRWQAVASDTGVDKAGDQTTLALYQDWIERAMTGQSEDWLPEPRMPFLGLSHYPDLGGFGEGGYTEAMFIDGKQFKVRGGFYNDKKHPLGIPLFNAIRQERAMVKRGEQVDDPIRISAAWFDVQHSHGDFIFTRKSMYDKCPMCEQGAGNKTFLKGQVDHWAATRVPINGRTSIGLEEKAMPKTRRQDAATIIADDELVAEMDLRAGMVGKSETETDAAESGAIIIKADSEDSEPIGMAIRRVRTDAGLTQSALAGELDGASRHMIGRLERGEVDPSDGLLEELSGVLGYEFVSRAGTDEPAADGLEERAKGKQRDFFPDDDDDEEMEEQMDGHGKRKKKRKGDDGMPMKMDMDGKDHYRPLGGATNVKEAEGVLSGQKKMAKAMSNWDILMIVAKNIVTDAEMSPDAKVTALGQAINETGSRIEQLKANLADAYLIQQSEASEIEEDDSEIELDFEIDEDYQPDADDLPESDEGRETMTHPADTLKSIYDEAIETEGLTVEQRGEMIQNGLTAFAQDAQSQLTQDGQPDQAAGVSPDAIKSAVAEGLQPIAESLALIAAKLGEAQAQQPVAQQPAPVQKSIAVQPSQNPATMQQQITERSAAHAVNTVVGGQQQPTTLRDHIRRSVGIVE